jgi:hypothetical protein
VTTTLETPLDTSPRLVGIQIEAKLRDWQIDYEYVPDFALSEIRVADWAQVRTAQHVAEPATVKEFRTQMGNGAVYPPIVLMHPNVLIDGNNRYAAARGLRSKTFPAFVGHFNSVDLARTFAAAVNQMGGRRLSPEEAQAAALTMLERGMADEAVAREIGRSVEMVRQVRRRREFELRSTELQLNEAATKISPRDQVKLAQIPHNPVFAEAVKLVAEAHPSSQTVTEIMKAASAARDDGEAIEAVRSIRAELDPQGPPPQPVVVPPEVGEATRALGLLLKNRERPVLLLDLTTSQRREASIARWTQARELAGQVLELYAAQ